MSGPPTRAASPPPGPSVLPPHPLGDYALLDTGLGEKLERIGPYVLRRPDPQAMWRPRRPARVWDAADLVFERESDRGGRWRAARGTVPEEWTIAHEGARLLVRPTAFKHVGVFPEQATNWRWTAEQVRRVARDRGEAPRVLNLFAYTGAATVLATRAGARVTHVDSSRPAMRWARRNAELSALPADAVRWIEDDASAFVRREVRRGARYEGILLDPPPYGRGAGKQRWVFEEDVVALLGACRELLGERGPAFLVLSCYAVGTSPLAFANMLADLGGGEVVAGELAIPEEDGARLLPAGLCGRYAR